MIHDKLENWPLYFSSAPWQCAFDFLAGLSSKSENERISLQDDDIYALIMSYETCSPEESVLETHNEYIDIQMSLMNSEAIDWFPRHVLEVKEPYDSDLDRTFYHRPDIVPVRVYNLPDFFTVLYSEDAHMPKLMSAGKPELVKKVVVKMHKRLLF